MSGREIVFSLNGKLLSHTRLRAFVFTPVVWRYRFRPQKWERMNFRLLFSTYGKLTFSLLMPALIVNVTIVTMACAEIKTKLTNGGAAKWAQCFPRQIKDKPLSALVLYARFRVFIRRCVVFAQSAKMSSAHAEPLFFLKVFFLSCMRKIHHAIRKQLVHQICVSFAGMKLEKTTCELLS